MELSTTIPALLVKHAAAHGSETILRKKDRGIWNAVTWSQLAEHVRGIGQGLLQAGLTPGATVAVLSGTRPELVYADLAILGCGAISAAVHPDEEIPQAGALLRETGATIAIVEGEEQLDKILTLRSECPGLRQIVIIDMKGLREFQDPICLSLADLVAAGASRNDWQQTMARVGADAPAAVLGAGQVVTHADIMRSVQDIGQSLGVRAGDERLAVLPMSDPTERIFGLYLALAHRIVSNYLENPETATENLREVKPNVLGANAEAWERLHARTAALAEAATGVQKALYNWAIDGGLLANLLVLRSVRTHLGFGNLRIAYVGDGKISPEAERWATGLGITVRHINPFQK